METGLTAINMDLSTNRTDDRLVGGSRSGGKLVLLPVSVRGFYLRRGHVLGLEDQLGQLKADLGVVEDGGDLAYRTGC